MAGRLKLITAPASEPVTTADLRAFGRISEDVPDATLVPLIIAARQQAEAHLNRALINQVWELIFDRFPRMPVSIARPPLVSLTSVTITDITGSTTTMATSDFVVDTSGVCGMLALKHGKAWPAVTPETGGVAIRFTAGYGAAAADVPETFRIAIMLGALSLRDNPLEPLPKAFFDMLTPERVMPV
jgi:uncharacterized phiE125 gp8 family phage protein